MDNGKKRVWFDVTEIQEWEGHYTGIQRVIFNLGRELSKTAEIELKICRYDRASRVFVETSYEFIEHVYIKTNDSFSSPESTLSYKVKNLAKRYVPRSAKKAAKKILEKRQSRLDSKIHPLRVSPDDIVFIPGAFWIDFMDTLLALKRAYSPKIIGIMYDLTPIIVPQYAVLATELKFKEEISKALKAVDKWFSISQNTKEDLLSYAQSQKLELLPEKVTVIRLGSNINPEGEALNPFQRHESPDGFILYVSTIEARKNQQLVYQTIKRAKEQKINLPPIVLAGKRGWLSDDLIEVIKRDPDMNKSLIWLERVDDRGMRWLYQNCLFTIYPSFYEGWGLPVAESLAYGKFCIASNTSSIPEIAGDLIDYFSPYSSDELLRLLQKYCDRSNLKVATQKAKRFKTTSWAETANQVLKVISSL